MQNKHLLLLLLITILFGSAFPISKLALNNSLPPILFGSLRMGIVFICLIPFYKFKIPQKKYIIPLIGFSLSMGTGMILFMNLAIHKSSVVSPIIIGAQLAIPFGIICSSLFLGEKVSKRKWILIIGSFIGIIFIGFDPELINQIFVLFLTVIMAFFYGLSQVFSRYLKKIDVKLTNFYMGLIGFITLLIISIIFEGNTINSVINIDFETWLLILHSSIVVSLIAHLCMFHLYKFYSVERVLPFYSLFPIFGIILTFLIFYEIPGFFEIIGGIIVITSIYLIHAENKNNN